MSLGCWKSLGSPTFKLSHTILKAFDGRSFPPHGLITACPIEMEGKIIQFDVEVVDAPIDYNMLLGCSWIHAMMTIMCSVFQLVQFPHQDKIITINQLDYCTPETNIHSNVPFVKNSKVVIQDVGVGMFKDSSLMGTFTIPPPISTPETTLVFTITSEVHFPLTIFTKSNTTMGSTSSMELR